MSEYERREWRDLWLAIFVGIPALVLLAAWLSSLAPQNCYDMNGEPCSIVKGTVHD